MKATVFILGMCCGVIAADFTHPAKDLEFDAPEAKIALELARLGQCYPVVTNVEGTSVLR